MTKPEVLEALYDWEADCYLVSEETTDPRVKRICKGLLSVIMDEQSKLEIDTTVDDGIDHEFLEGFMQDPIIHKDDGWFFFDETWGNVIGPFKSRGAAVFGLKQYVKGLG